MEIAVVRLIYYFFIFIKSHLAPVDATTELELKNDFIDSA